MTRNEIESMASVYGLAVTDNLYKFAMAIRLHTKFESKEICEAVGKKYQHGYHGNDVSPVYEAATLISNM